MQVVRVVIVRVILVGVLGVTVVHIGHDEVLVVVLKSEAIFVVIFCIWRCTFYRNQTFAFTLTDPLWRKLRQRPAHSSFNALHNHRA